MIFFKSKKDKELIKKLKQEEKELDLEIEKELDEKYPKKKQNLIDIIDDLTTLDDEDYLNSEFVTESEKKEILGMKEEDKKLFNKVLVAIIIIVSFGTTGIFVFKSAIRTRIEKITIPIVEEYYTNRYKDELKVKDFYEDCYKEYNRKETKEICTGEVIITTESDKHIVTLNDKFIGDDISYSKTLDKYKEQTLKYFYNFNIVGSNHFLSYQDYYRNYNINLSYIHVLPSEIEFDKLLYDNKLTIRDEIFYQGEFNENLALKYIRRYSDDSIMYFIKLERGLPVKLNVVTKDKVLYFTILSKITLDKGITYYEFDRNETGIKKFKFKEIKGVDITLSDSSKEVVKAYNIDFNKQYVKKGEIEKPKYYMLSFEKGMFNYNNLVYLNTEREEVELDKFANVTFFSNGGLVYMIHNDKVSFASVTKKTSWLCVNLNIC